MIRQTGWVERKFNFDFPPGLFPCILSRLNGAPARIEEMLAGQPDSMLTTRYSGKWSIQEHAGHLYELDAIHEGRIDDFLAGAAVLRSADITNRKTEQERYNEKDIRDVAAAFRAARHAMVERLALLSDGDIVRTAEHPRLKNPMRMVDMVLFVAEHDDHHIAKMASLLHDLHR